MKTITRTLAAAVTLAVTLARSQNTPAKPAVEEGLPPLTVEDPTLAESWRFHVEVARLDFSSTSDALQHRTDVNYDSDDPWSAGESSGDGYGLSFCASLDDKGIATLRLKRASTEYELAPPGGFHRILTDRDDAQLDWTQTTEEGKDWARGWLAGVRLLSESKDVLIEEQGHDFRFDADADWKLLTGGYFFNWRPFHRWVRLIGAVNFLFGEVDGICREAGADDNWKDGKLSDGYAKSDSLCYGANAALTLYVDFPRFVSIGIGYHREWLYAFDATDSGMAMYPDNDDAKFISNSGYVAASIIGRF